MMGLRRTAVALLGVLAALLAAVLVPVAAAAAGGGNISILSAGPDSTGDPYDLTVFAADANGVAITSMVAHVFNSANVDVADVTMTAVSTTITGNQQWAANPNPISQSVLPPGTYTVQVDAGDGTTTDLNDTGLIPAQQLETFSYTTTVSVTPSQTTVTEGNDNVSFSGTVTGQAPGGTAVPLPNVPVNVSISGGAPTSVGPTATDGSFSYSATGIQATSDYNFTVASTSTYSAGNKDVSITAIAATTSMTAGASPPNISEGSTNVTFSGNVQAGGVNLSGLTVNMSFNGGTAAPLSNPTDSNGNYSTTVSNAQPGTYTFTVGGATLYSGASASTIVGTSAAATTMTMNPPSPANVSEGAQTVTFSGTVTTTAGNSPVGGAAVSVTTPGSSTSTQVTTTASDGTFSWTDTIANPGQYAFSIPNDPNGLYSGSSGSSTVGVTLANTTITLPTTPLTVTEGQTQVLINGTVTALPPGSIAAATPIANSPVYLNGGPSPVATTDSNGQFSYLATNVTATTVYSFSVPPGPLYGAGSGSVTVTAVQAPTSVSVTPPSATVTQGSDSVPFVVTANASPPGITLPTPVLNAPVLLSINGGPATQVGTTGTTGTFADTIAGITTSAPYTFSIGSTTLSAASSATPVQVTTQAATTNINVTPSPPSVHGPETVTFSGSDLTTGTNPVAIAGAPVYLSVSGGPASQVTTTQSDGSFSYQLAGAIATVDYNFSVPGTTLYTSATQDIVLKVNEASTSIAVTPVPTSVTEGAQSVTFNGSVTGTLALHGNTIPLASVPVSLAVHGQPVLQTVTTDSNGNFTATVTGVGRTSSFDFTIAAGSDYTKASTQVQIVAMPAKTRIVRASTTPRHLKYGQKVTIAGIAQYLGAGGWVALPASHVLVKVGAYRPVQLKTGADGSFSATLPTERGPDWTASVVHGFLLSASSTGGTLTIQLPLRVNFFTAKLTVGATVAVTGCLQTTAPDSRGPNSRVHIDYAASNHGPWRQLGLLPLRNGARNPSNCRAASEAYFSGSIRAKLANAYYRASFAANFGFDAVVSKVVHSARTPTKITNFAVKPLEVNTGGVVTISGRLMRLGKTWQPYANRSIVIFYNQKGTVYTTTLGSPVTTSKNGYFIAKGRAGSGKFVAVLFAVYKGSSTDLASRSNGIDVSINHGRGSPTGDGGLVPSLLRSVMPSLALIGAEVIAARDNAERLLHRDLVRRVRV